jgi:Fe-S oxidoreductase
MPPVPSGTLYRRLPACGPGQAVVVEPEKPAMGTIFYFPGCGSERLYSQISLAAIHILIHAGVRVILPPPFQCCGFPAQVNAKAELHRNQAMRVAIILNQIRERFGHFQFDAVAVSCGTCREALVGMNAPAIFDAPMADISRLFIDRGLTADIPFGCLYHAPCHDSLDGEGPALLQRLGRSATVIPHCCGEAGTLALSRPDIAAAMRSRKKDAFKGAIEKRVGKTLVLTNCPACISGLGRNQGLGLQVRHLAVELARAVDGERWLDKSRMWQQRAKVVSF